MSKRIFFVVAALALFVGGLYFRGASGASARSQADQIAKIDLAAGDTVAALSSLKLFVATHMGASTIVTLQGSYNRALAAAQAAAAIPDPNNKIYAAAQAACAGKSDSITQARCNQTYLSQHLSTVPTPAPVVQPRLADYQTKLKAPLWTPDLAGALLLGSGVALVLCIPALRRKS